MVEYFAVDIRPAALIAALLSANGRRNEYSANRPSLFTNRSNRREVLLIASSEHGPRGYEALRLLRERGGPFDGSLHKLQRTRTSLELYGDATSMVKLGTEDKHSLIRTKPEYECETCWSPSSANSYSFSTISECSTLSFKATSFVDTSPQTFTIPEPQQ